MQPQEPTPTPTNSSPESLASPAPQEPSVVASAPVVNQAVADTTTPAVGPKKSNSKMMIMMAVVVLVLVAIAVVVLM